MPIKHCRRLQPEDKLGVNNLGQICVCTWKHSSHCDLDICLIPPLRDVERRSCSAVPSLQFSSSTNPVSTVSCRDATQESWRCCRLVSWGGVFGWPWSAARQGSSRGTAGPRAPSVTEQMKGAEPGCSALYTKLTCSCSCRALCYQLLSVITAVIFHIIIFLALSLST